MPKKKPIKGKPKVDPELDGLEIKVNEFGQIESNYDLEKIIKFLNKKVEDKKLQGRDDISDEGEFLNENSEEKTDEETD